MILIKLILFSASLMAVFILVVWMFGMIEKKPAGGTKTYVLPKIRGGEHTIKHLVRRFFFGTKSNEINYLHTTYLTHEIRKSQTIIKLLKKTI